MISWVIQDVEDEPPGVLHLHRPELGYGFGLQVSTHGFPQPTVSFIVVLEYHA